MSISSSDLIAIQARLDANRKGAPGAAEAIPEDAATEEDVLQAQIIEHCKQERWVVFYNLTKKKTNRPVGEPDLLCFLPGGVTLLAELKSKTGKPSEDQVIVHHCLRRNGHIVHIIRSFSQFLAVLKDLPRGEANTGA